MDPMTCPSCGKRLSPFWPKRCEHCKAPFTPEFAAMRAMTGMAGEMVSFAGLPGQWTCSKPLKDGEHCGLAPNHPGPCVPETGTAVLPPVVQRTYRGRSMSDAGVALGIDAPQMTAAGYSPVNQSWRGASAAWAVVLALVLTVIGLVFLGIVGAVVGLVVGLVLVVVRPGDGTLTVTYRR